MPCLLTPHNVLDNCTALTGNNEIDEGLLKLLQQNIDAARAAGQEQPVQFMEKIRDAARRFMLKQV